MITHSSCICSFQYSSRTNPHRRLEICAQIVTRAALAFPVESQNTLAHDGQSIVAHFLILYALSTPTGFDGMFSNSSSRGFQAAVHQIPSPPTLLHELPSATNRNMCNSIVPRLAPLGAIASVSHDRVHAIKTCALTFDAVCVISERILPKTTHSAPQVSAGHAPFRPFRQLLTRHVAALCIAG
jgi:hypothetical protein